MIRILIKGFKTYAKKRKLNIINIINIQIKEIINGKIINI